MWSKDVCEYVLVGVAILNLVALSEDKGGSTYLKKLELPKDLANP